MPPLRASQVETLRFICESETGRTTTEVHRVCGAPWQEHGDTYGRLEILRLAGYLARGSSRFRLTQLGREALEGVEPWLTETGHTSQRLAGSGHPPFALAVTPDPNTSETHRCPSCGECYPLRGTCFGFGPQHPPTKTERVHGA